MNKIQKIKDIVSIIDIANRYGANSNSKGKCKHNPLRTEATCSLVLYPETNTYYDFGNKDGGDVIDFVCAADGFDIPDSIENICRMYNIDTNDNYIPTPKTITVPEKDYIKPEKLLTAFNAITKRFNENTRESLFTIAPEYVFKEAKSEDKIEFFNLVRYYEPESSPVVLLPDSKGTSYTFRYRYKTIDDEQKKWVAHYNTKSNYPYCRLNENRLTLIVEGSRDFLTALLCGYSVIALPSAGFQLDNELLKDRLCVFIDDDDDKEFMKPLFENAICEKIWFEHKKFKEITKCNSKDFSDYLYQFDNLEKFKHTFEKFIYTLNDILLENWEDGINKNNILTLEFLNSKPNIEPLIDGFIYKQTSTVIHSDPGQGKSILILSIIKEALKNKTIDRVIYFDADNPISVLKDRLENIISIFGDKIIYYSSARITSDAMKDEMKRLCLFKDQGSRTLIICDTFGRYVDGVKDEKDVIPMLNIINDLTNRFGATTIALHHSNKTKDENGMPIFQGSQKIIGDTDGTFSLTRKGSKLRIKKDKGRFSDMFDYINLEVDAKEFDIKSFKGNFIGEDFEDDDKDGNDDIDTKLIEDILKDGDFSQKTIKDKLKGKSSLSKVYKTLKDNKDILWRVYKSPDNKNEWLYTLIERKSNDPVVTVYSDDDIDNIFGGME